METNTDDTSDARDPIAEALERRAGPFEELMRLERELGRIDGDLADLALDMYNDYRWRDVADPLAVDVGGNPRWQHLKWLENGRHNVMYSIEMWHRERPADSARIRAERGESEDERSPGLEAEVARLRQLAGLE